MIVELQPTLVGELVRVRPMVPGDVDALWAISSDPLLWEQHPAKERSEPEGFRQWFADALAAGALAVEERATGEVVGTSRFHGFDPVASEVEIGWTFLARRHWGGPFNPELKRLMVDHAARFVDTVRFRVHEGNRRSQRAVEKLGATRRGTEPDAEGRGHNVVFALRVR